MTCPNCGAPLRVTEHDDSFRCEYCRSVYTPQENDEGVRFLGEASALKCPVCAVPLEQAALGGHRILSCRRCQGLLVGMEEFVALVGELRAEHSGPGSVQFPPNRDALSRQINCPKCQQRMDTHFYEGPGNIIIDACSYCQLDWLDKGELLRVVHAPDHSYAHEPYGQSPV